MSKSKLGVKDIRARSQEEAITELQRAAPHLNFSKFVYINESTKSTVILTDGTETQNSFRNVIRSGGEVRGASRRKTNEGYLVELRESLESTGDLNSYDLSSVNYVKATEKVRIICKTHGEKLISPFPLLNGRRCGECKGARLAKHFAAEWEDIKSKAMERHLGKYTYEKFIYVNTNTKGEVHCTTCGSDFEVRMYHHLGRGDGCIVCAKQARTLLHLEVGPKVFLEKANEVHLGKYTYNNMVYTNCKEWISVTCPVLDKHGVPHGDFMVYPDNHIYAKVGCPKCTRKTSKAEIEIRDYVISLGLEVEPNVPILGRQHVDILIPELNTGIEYNGLFWHGEKNKKDAKEYHLNKFLKAKEVGIRLIQIFEDEWVHYRPKVEEILRTKLGKGVLTSYARNTTFVEVENTNARRFYEEVHMQGGVTSLGKSFGLTIEGRLIACMSFSIANVESGFVDLTRFASVGRVPGGFSKLIKNSIPYLVAHGKHTITSFSDNRWSDGGVYSRNGFVEVPQKILPRYWWVDANERFDDVERYGDIKRLHRRGFQKKALAAKLGERFFPNETEIENAERNGYYRVWDAGVTKWKMEI